MIIDVGELEKEAARITAENQAGKAQAAEDGAKQAAFMQDAAVRRKYGEQPAGSNKKHKGKARADSPIDFALPKSYATVRAWAEDKGRSYNEVLGECRAGKVPTPFKFFDPESADFTGEAEFDEPYFESGGISPRGAGPSGTASGMRKELLVAFEKRNEIKSKTLSLDELKEKNRAEESELKEKNRAEERKKELELEEKKVNMQSKQMEMMMKMQMAIMQKAFNVPIDEEGGQ